MAVARLGALAFDATDIPAWRTILVDILGMEERPRADDTEPARFRYDELEHRISLHPSDTDGVHGITWEVDTAAELEDLGRRVTEHGITVEWHEHGVNGARRLGALVHVHRPGGLSHRDPFRGHVGPHALPTFWHRWWLPHR